MLKFTRVSHIVEIAKTRKYFSTLGQSKKQSLVSPEQMMEKYKIIFDKSHILEDIMPRKFKTGEELSSYFGLNATISPFLTIQDKITLESINRSVNAPIWDLLERGGKRWRPILGLMIGKYLDLNIEESQQCLTLYKILGCIEVLHNATLVIDDVIDQSDFRRNKPCTYKIYGQAIALNTGIGLLYYPVNRAIHHLNSTDKGKFLIHYTHELAAINFGQTIDFEMNDSKRIIDVSNYVDTVLCKTGVFPRLMVKLIYDICIDDPEKKKTRNHMLKIMDLLSIAFQIEDDLLNIEDNDVSKNKGIIGEDIYEGKLTLMVIKAVQKLEAEKRKRLRDILFMKTKDASLINEAINLMKSGGGVAFASEYMNNCIKEAETLCAELPYENNSAREAIDEIIKLIHFLIKKKV